MSYLRLVKKLIKRYPFLNSVTIDVDEGYGLTGATCYRNESNSIYVDVAGLRKVFKTARYVRRWGGVPKFQDFILATLLHEIRHVWQHQNLSEQDIKSAILDIAPGDDESHDASPLEIDADRWAKRELKKLCKNS